MPDVPPAVKGMNDILPPEVSKWHFLEEKARGVLEAFAYREIRTPVLEYTPLFVRSVGEVTDVVEKQMYTFDDRDGRSVSLRPEMTASVVRAYVAESQWNKEPVTRWYYAGPMFRHERAQRGRLRQFHQIGAELFGAAEPSADAEMIAMLVTLLADLELPGSSVEVTINSLGEPEERAAYRDALVAYFSARRDRLDDDSRRRCCSTAWARRRRPGSSVCASCSTASASSTPWIRASCVGSTTTRRRSSRSNAARASSAPKIRSRAVGATIG